MAARRQRLWRDWGWTDLVQLNVKLIGRLTDYGHGDGAITLPDEVTINDVLSELGIVQEEVGPVSLNNSVVSRARWGGTTLQEGDHLPLMPPLKGG